MPVSIDQLPAQLKRGLAPIYFIYGDEPLLVQEACDAVRGAALAAGFGEREVLTVEAGFDWDGLYASTQSMSLFSARRLIELRIPNGKPGDAGSKILGELGERPPADIMLLITTGKLEKQARESKWVKGLEKSAVTVAVWPVEAGELPAWISRRMVARGLKPGSGVAELLAHHMEGNLLAAAQEIDKIAMLTGGGAVSADDIEGNLGDNARFTVFGLADTCLRGNAAEILRMLASLRGEGLEPVLVLWALAREARDLAAMAQQVAAGKPAAAVLEERRVWARRRPLVSQALKRLRADECLRLVQRAARADRVLKGRRRGDVWQELECLALGIAGTRPRTCQ
jgi:DNA polymerase III subunit delta